MCIIVRRPDENDLAHSNQLDSHNFLRSSSETLYDKIHKAFLRATGSWIGSAAGNRRPRASLITIAFPLQLGVVRHLA